MSPQVLGTLTRRSGDFDAAEDAVQEALLAAVDHWPSDGVPPNPRGWLLRTAALRLIDQRRSERSRRQREAVVELSADGEAEATTRDDTLLVLFLCCHPALSPPSAIALTLRAVGGLSTAEIARAFVVSEATMAQRISRAKQRIKASGVPFRLPPSDKRLERLPSVLRILYLIFNEGYARSTGATLHRTDLSDEAIRLTRMLHRALPEDPEVAGLLALMLLIDARRPARTSASGEVISLADQDRARWDQTRIAEGTALIDAAIGRGRVGEYQIQAAIAAIHDRALDASETDWSQILALYGLLEQMTGNPIVTLNRAVATAMVDGPHAGLEVLDAAADRLIGHHRLDAVRAHLLEMAGDPEAAMALYRRAAARATNLPEQRYLARRAARLKSRLERA